MKNKTDHTCERCGDETAGILPNGVPFCAYCDGSGAMVQTAFGWYLDQQNEIPVAKWRWNDRGNGPELVYPADGVYGPFDGPKEEEAEQQSRAWIVSLPSDCA